MDANNEIFSLDYAVQHYAWGKLGQESLVYKLYKGSGFCDNPAPNKPYAELWMGDHPNGPSLIQTKSLEKVSLRDSIAQNPELFLGKAYDGKNKSLPFLFKVLSVNTILSLQVHPDKEKAMSLHQKFPEIYKDGNHKPEIAIALSEFEAFCKFRPREEIIQALQENKVVAEFIGKDLVEKFIHCDRSEANEVLRSILKEILTKNKDEVKLYIDKLLQYISERTEKSARDNLVYRIHELYPYDSGVFISYFLNYIVMKPGEAIIMGPNEPHAYIKGDCIECMAGSDNVVRACFTSKLIDKETLCEIISTEMKHAEITNGEKLDLKNSSGFEIIKYPTPFSEFICYSVRITQSQTNTIDMTFETPSIVLAIKGEGIIKTKNTENKSYRETHIKEGQSFYILPCTSFHFGSHEAGLEVCICTSQVVSVD